MSIIDRLLGRSWESKQKAFLEKKRKRLRNHDFSIFSNNCVGGVIYHDLGERFNSPTVNLWFKREDFFTLLDDLDYYLNAEIVEAFEKGIDYPVGRIYRGDAFITIYFMHYGSFSDAVEKWKERAKRVNKDNLFVVLEYPAINDTDEQQTEIKSRFDAIPYSNKVMLTKRSALSGKNIVHMRFYDEPHHSGKILERKDERSVKRYLDDFDYVSFLNSGKRER